MKNESGTGPIFKIMTYENPRPKEENFSKVKIDLENGTLINPKVDSLTLPSLNKPAITFPNLNNLVFQQQTLISSTIKPDTDEKQPYVPHSNKLVDNIRPNDIIYQPELKREEGYEFLSGDAHFFMTQKESVGFDGPAAVLPVMDHWKNSERSKPKKKKKEHLVIGNHHNMLTSNINLLEGDTRSGRWTKEEHKKFIEAICKFGNEWKKVQQHIKTRSSTQARSHAQKFFLRLKKKFNLSNKDSATSFQELKKYPEETIINYIKECTNSDANIDIEQKDKLISVLVNFANFTKKSKRRRSKNSLEADNSSMTGTKANNMTFERKFSAGNNFNGNMHNENHYRIEDGYHLNDDCNQTNNNLNHLSEENDEDMEDAQSRSRKIFQITKVRKGTDGSVLKNISSMSNIKQSQLPSENSLLTLNSSVLNQQQQQFNSSAIKQELSSLNDTTSLLTETQQSVNNNHIGIPFNIKCENPLARSNSINQLDITKTPIAIIPGQTTDNKQNYNYINVVTINVCPPVPGVNNVANVNSKQVKQQPMVYNNSNNNNSKEQQQPTATINQSQLNAHFIKTFLYNNYLRFPQNNSNNSNQNSQLNNTLINNIQKSMPNGIQLTPQLSSQLYQGFNNIKPKLVFNNGNSLNNVQGINSTNNSSQQGFNQPLNNSGTPKLIISTINPNQTSNNMISSFGNIGILNNGLNSPSVINNGKYDEMKNFFKKESPLLNQFSQQQVVEATQEKARKGKQQPRPTTHTEKIQINPQSLLFNQVINKPQQPVNIVQKPVSISQKELTMCNLGQRPSPNNIFGSSGNLFTDTFNLEPFRREDDYENINPFNIDFNMKDPYEPCMKDEDLCENDFFNNH